MIAAGVLAHTEGLPTFLINFKNINHQETRAIYADNFAGSCLCNYLPTAMVFLQKQPAFFVLSSNCVLPGGGGHCFGAASFQRCGFGQGFLIAGWGSDDFTDDRPCNKIPNEVP